MAEQDSHRGALQQAIITSIRARVRGDENRIKSPCLGVAWAKDRQSLLGYAFGNTRNFLQIYLAMPSLLPKVKRDVVWRHALRVLLAVERPFLIRPLFAPKTSLWLQLLRAHTDVDFGCVFLGWLCTHARLMQLPFRQVKTLLADGIHVAGYGQLCSSTSYESNVPFVLRFMVRVAVEST